MSKQIKVKFTVSFFGGILDGISIPQEISFCNRDSADSWIEAVSGRDISECGGFKRFSGFEIL